MQKCLLHGFGPCAGKMSREHYISRTALEAIGQAGKSQIGGLAWQPEETMQVIGNGSLVAKILCEAHNSTLSSLDTVGGALIRAVDAADKQPESLPALTTIDGLLFERWLLKVICGLTAGGGFKTREIPEHWKRILMGEPWPDGWGLYVPSPEGQHVLAKEFAVETRVHPTTNEVKAAFFRVAGVHFTLLVGRPDDPRPWGFQRPRGLIFRDGTTEKRIEFAWPIESTEAVIYTKVGTTSAPVPQWSGWRQ